MTRFSKRTITCLGDALAAWSVVREIQAFFEDADIALGPQEAGAEESSVRRALMRQYLATVNLDDARDTAKVCEVMTSVLEELRRQLPESQQPFDRLLRSIRRDRFSVDEATLRVTVPSTALTEAALAALPDADAIRDHLRRLNDNVDTDPRLAVSVAKDLVESTAKLVLRQRGVAYAPTDKLTQLVARAQQSLGLSAATAVGGTDHEQRALKTILGSLTQLAQGITELRNNVGVGHGRESVPTWVRSRHARMAAGAAQVWCQLLLETLDDPTAPWRSPTE